jgi:PH (Pleckstrin Homology) domain-containing protein
MRQVSLVQSGPPASVNRYLLPDERSVITVRMHPAALARPLILAGGGLVAARKLISRSARPDIVWGTYLLLPLDFLRRLAAWPVTYLAVTEKRMVLIGGLASRTAAAMPLDKVTGLTLQRTVPGRLLGYGTLIVASPGRRQAFRKVRYLPYPEQLYLEISALLWPEEPGGTVSPEAGGGEGMTANNSAEPFQQE